MDCSSCVVFFFGGGVFCSVLKYSLFLIKLKPNNNLAKENISLGNFHLDGKYYKNYLSNTPPPTWAWSPLPRSGPGTCRPYRPRSSPRPLFPALCGDDFIAGAARPPLLGLGRATAPLPRLFASSHCTPPTCSIPLYPSFLPSTANPPTCYVSGPLKYR